MKPNFFFELGRKAATLATTAPIRPRYGGKFMRKATGSTKAAPHHSMSKAVTAPTGLAISK